MELRDYLLLIRKKLWVIILFTFVVGIISYYIIFYCMEDIYQADTTLYVDTSIGNNFTQAELMAGRYLAQDYQELVKSRTITETVIEQLNIKNLTANEVARMVKVNLVSDTRVFKISVQHTDRQLVAVIANTVAEIFIDRTVNLMKISNINIIDKAEVPLSPIKPNRQGIMILAILLGLSVSSGIIILMEYLDDSVKTSEDIERNIELPVIGAIPMFKKTSTI